MNKITALTPLLGGIAGSLLLSSLVTLPALFPYSDGLFAGLSAFLFTVAIACFLPDNALYTPKEQLVHAFKAKHGTTADNAESALDLMNTALYQARTLKAFMPYFSEQNKPAVKTLIDTLEDVAAKIFSEPRNIRVWQPAIHRGALVLEAAESKAKIMRKRVSPSYREEAESHMRKAIESAQHTFDNAEKSAADSIMLDLDTAASTASDLAKS